LTKIYVKDINVSILSKNNECNSKDIAMLHPHTHTNRRLFISWEIQGFGGGKEERSSSSLFLSLSQVRLVRPRATSRVICVKPQIAGQRPT